MAGFELDKERAKWVIRTTASMLERKVFPFNQPGVFPDAIVPEGMTAGSLAHAALLFCSCNIDKGRDADQVWKALRGISEETNILDLHCLSEERLTELISKHLESVSGRNYGDPVGTLYHNSMLLHESYGGDPRKIAFDDSGKLRDVDDTLKHLMQFKQFGIGTGALLMKNMVRFGYWEYDPCDIYIKVDRHVLRISEGTRVLVPHDKDETRVGKWVKPLMKLYREGTREAKISAVDFDDAIWGIGHVSCRPRDKIYCLGNCELNCENNAITRKQASYMTPGTERRKNAVKGQRILF